MRRIEVKGCFECPLQRDDGFGPRACRLNGHSLRGDRVEHPPPAWCPLKTNGPVEVRLAESEGE